MSILSSSSFQKIPTKNCWRLPLWPWTPLPYYSQVLPVLFSWNYYHHGWISRNTFLAPIGFRSLEICCRCHRQSRGSPTGSGARYMVRFSHPELHVNAVLTYATLVARRCDVPRNSRQPSGHSELLQYYCGSSGEALWYLFWSTSWFHGEYSVSISHSTSILKAISMQLHAKNGLEPGRRDGTVQWSLAPFPQIDHCSDEEGLCKTVPSDSGKRGGKVSRLLAQRPGALHGEFPFVGIHDEQTKVYVLRPCSSDTGPRQEVFCPIFMAFMSQVLMIPCAMINSQWLSYFLITIVIDYHHCWESHGNGDICSSAGKFLGRLLSCLWDLLLFIFIFF